MPVSLRGTPTNGVGAASTTITWTLPAGVQAGDSIVIFVQSEMAGTSSTISTPSGFSPWSGRAPASGSFPFYSFVKVAAGGETTVTATASASEVYRWGAIVGVGAGAFWAATNGFHSANATHTSPALTVAVGDLVIVIDGVENSTTTTVTTTSTNPSLTFTEHFDTGSTTQDVWVAGYTAISASASTNFVITTTRSVAPSGGAHTTMWGVLSAAPPIDLTATKLTNTSTFGSLKVTGAIQPTKLTNVSTFGAAAVSGGTFQMLPTRLVNVSTFGSPTVQKHRIDLDTPADVDVVATAPTTKLIQSVSETDVLAAADPPLISTFNEEIGFEVVVRSHTDYNTIIAVIGDYIELTIGPELSAEGNGSITMDADSPFWYTNLPDGSLATTLLDFEHLWEVYERGILRFQFLGMSVREILLEDDLGRGISVSGPGTPEVLRWGKIFPPTFPGKAVSPYKFTSSTMMGAFISLLNACKNRGTATWITPTFTGLVDSAGVSWADRSDPRPFEPTEGIDLLDLLGVCTGQDVDNQAIVQAEWYMRPNFMLEAKPTIGTDKSQSVVFYDNATRVIERTRLRDEVYNHILVSDGNRNTSISNAALAAVSKTRWNQREWYEKKSEVILGTDRQVLANGLLALMQEEKSTWVIEVAYDTPGLRPFVDYDIGDTVGVARYTPVGVNPLTGAVSGGTRAVENYRVLAIVLKVQSDGEVRVELTLQSRLETKQRSLQKQIGRLLYDINNPKPRNFLQKGADNKDFTDTDFLAIEIALPDPGWPYYVEASGMLQWVLGHNVGYDVFIHMDSIEGEIFSIGWGLWNLTNPPIDVTVRVNCPVGRTENSYSGEHTVQMWLERNRSPGSTPGNGISLNVDSLVNYLYVTMIKA